MSRRNLLLFISTLLTIEFLDELVFGTREAAWPLIRDELKLSYTQVGLLLSVPAFFAGLVEPLLGLLADIWRRKILVIGGGIFFTIGLMITASSQSFLPLMVSFMLLGPSSGAFVNLSQAALMDADAIKMEKNMARWCFAGSLGMVFGSLSVGVAAYLGISWRELFAVMAILSLLLVVTASRFSFRTTVADESLNLREGILNALSALKRREVLNWLVLLAFSNLMLDLLHGFLALYFVDVVGATKAQAALAVMVWTFIGLPGDLILIRLLDRVDGLTYLRFSSSIALILFPLFLLVPGVSIKLVLLGLLGLFNAGWYSILKANLYSSMPGQSGTVITIYSLFSLVDGLMPIFIGRYAEYMGLEAAMWLLLLGPIALLIGLRR